MPNENFATNIEDHNHVELESTSIDTKSNDKDDRTTISNKYPHEEFHIQLAIELAAYKAKLAVDEAELAADIIRIDEINKLIQECINNRCIDQERINKENIDDENIHNTKYCKAKVKSGQQCTKFKTKDTNYCRYHNVWTTYTQDQLNRIGKCGYCELYAPIIVFDAKTMIKNWKNWCDTCVTKNTFCKGLTTQDIPCGNFSSEGKFYCDYHHRDMNDYTEEQRNNISKCPKCGLHRYVIDGKCTKCIKKDTDNDKHKCIGFSKKKQRCTYSVEEGFRTCKIHIDMENYTDEMLQNLKQCKLVNCSDMKYFEGDYCNKCQAKKDGRKILLCRAKANNGDQCRNDRLDNLQICGRHIDMKDYDEYMYANLKLCGSGRHYRYCGDYDTCEKCRNIGHNNRLIAKQKLKKEDMCIKCGVHKKKIGDYCGLHVGEIKIKEAIENGNRICSTPRCKHIIPNNDEITKCDRCIAHYKLGDKNKASKLLKLSMEADKLREETNWMISLCIICKNEKHIDNFLIDARYYNEEKSEFEENYSYRCEDCREKGRCKDRIRNNLRTNEGIIVNQYMRDCLERRRNISWELTVEQGVAFLNKSCAYCGFYEEKVNDNGIKYHCMGIDRKDSSKGYTMANCVSCCAICNYIKGKLSDNEFMICCTNIYNNFGTIEKADHKQRSYGYLNYQKCAENRDILFRLTENEYDEITSNVCYYCANSNNSGQIGIDRVRSDRGYCMKTNDLVAACKICNYMKLTYDIKVFYEQILKIIEHSERSVKISFFNVKHNPTRTNDRKKLEKLISQLNSVKTEDELIDRRNNVCFYNDNFYIDQILRTYDITSVKPIIVFCDTVELVDIWKYYRNITSSVPRNDIHSNGFRNIKILVKDMFTNKYIGIIELRSFSINCNKLINDYLNWDKETKFDRKNNVMDISTCVPLQPFGFNYACGKLLVKLAFSKEVYDYYKKLYADNLYGLLTFSIDGKSTQYENLKELTYLGNTQGYGIDKHKNFDGICDDLKYFLDKWGISPSKNKIFNIEKFCDYVGIPSVVNHGIERGIYFGFTGERSKEYLSSTTLPNEQFFYNLKTVDEQAQMWIIDIAVPRFEDVIKRNCVVTFHDYNYYNYYVTDSGKKKHNYVQKYESTSTVYKHWSNEDIQKMIKCWYENKYKAYLQIANLLSNDLPGIDRRYIKKIIDGNMRDNVSDEQSRLRFEYQRDLERRYKYNQTKLNKCIDQRIITTTQMTNNYINKKQQMINLNGSDKLFSVTIKKHNLHLLHYDRDTKNNNVPINKFYSVGTIYNIAVEKWTINKSYLYDDDIIFDMQSNVHNSIEHKLKMNEWNVNNNDHNLQFIGLYQTPVVANNPIVINDPNIFGSPYHVTGSNNIFIRLDPLTQSFIIHAFADENNVIHRILIKYSSFGKCKCYNCSCEFKGISINQSNVRDNESNDSNVRDNKLIDSKDQDNKSNNSNVRDNKTNNSKVRDNTLIDSKGQDNKLRVDVQANCR